MQYIHTYTHTVKMKYYSAIKRNNNGIFNNTDGSQITILNKVTQRKKKYHITYMWNLIKINLFTQQKPIQKI